MKTLFAVFVLVQLGNSFAATTRAKDRGEAGKIGLPGGKVDMGEHPIQAVVREAREEGWDVCEVNPFPIRSQLVDGKLVYWYRANKAKKLENYKEKGRIQPILASAEEILNSGYGNENLKIF